MDVILVGARRVEVDHVCDPLRRRGRGPRRRSRRAWTDRASLEPARARGAWVCEHVGVQRDGADVVLRSLRAMLSAPCLVRAKTSAEARARPCEARRPGRSCVSDVTGRNLCATLGGASIRRPLSSNVTVALYFSAGSAHGSLEGQRRAVSALRGSVADERGRSAEENPCRASGRPRRGRARAHRATKTRSHVRFKSSRRPGVATRICAPRARFACLLTEGSRRRPPQSEASKAAERAARALRRPGRASSRVGTRSSAAGRQPGRAHDGRSTRGIPKASVLPEPVGDAARSRSTPPRASGKTRCCTSNGVSDAATLERAHHRRALTPSAEKRFLACCSTPCPPTGSRRSENSNA